MSCCEPPSLPFIKMLTMNQVSLHCQDDDDNNNLTSLGALALKMMSSRCGRRAAVRSPVSGPKRCLFGAPSATETQRLVREDQDAANTRMLRRWGWDLVKERPATPSTIWQWEPVRSHPYKRCESVRLPSPTTIPAAVSPLPSTPSLNTSATSSSSGTSTLSASPESCSSATSSPTPPPPCRTPWYSDDSCCGDSDSDTSTTCGTSPRPTPTPVQSRITDFWRTRRCSTSENIVKANPVGTPARTCSV